MKNPWLEVPAGDYEAHMALPEVAQTQALSLLIASALDEFSPASLAVMGCTTGNGFERIDPAVTKRVVGIDINPVFLDILESRFKETLAGLELIEADIAGRHFEIEPVELAFAGLLFEYVDVRTSLRNISKSITPGGTLVAALQLPSKHSSPVSTTPYKSLEILAPVLKLVQPDEFSAACSLVGLREVKTETMPLKKGKAFFIGHYRKNAS